jgi:MFS family permease
MRTSTLNWYWVTAAVVGPVFIGVLAATLFWRRSDPALGSAIGSTIALAAVAVFFLREYMELAAFEEACRADQASCRSVPGTFMRGAIYAFAAFATAAIIHLVGLRVSERRLRRSVWQRTT